MIVSHVNIAVISGYPATRWYRSQLQRQSITDLYAAMPAPCSSFVFAMRIGLTCCRIRK